MSPRPPDDSAEPLRVTPQRLADKVRALSLKVMDVSFALREIQYFLGHELVDDVLGREASVLAVKILDLSQRIRVGSVTITDFLDVDAGRGRRPLLDAIEATEALKPMPSPVMSTGAGDDQIRGVLGLDLGWRDIPVAWLKLRSKIVSKLIDLGITSMGQLQGELPQVNLQALGFDAKEATEIGEAYLAKIAAHAAARGKASGQTEGDPATSIVAGDDQVGGDLGQARDPERWKDLPVSCLDIPSAVSKILISRSLFTAGMVKDALGGSYSSEDLGLNPDQVEEVLSACYRVIDETRLRAAPAKPQRASRKARKTPQDATTEKVDPIATGSPSVDPAVREAFEQAGRNGAANKAAKKPRVRYSGEPLPVQRQRIAQGLKAKESES